MKKKNETKKEEVFIRSDGWVFTKDGLDRLRAGGHKGFDRFMENNEKKLGGWNRLLKPLDPDAAAVLKTIKQPVERGRFLSTAIVSENGRKRTGGVERASAEAPAEFMRLTVSDDALAVVVDMPNADFRAFVSTAILRAAKKRG